jgi:PKD repeat protein
VYLAFSGVDPQVPEDVEVLLAQRAGSRWNPPTRFSRSVGEDRFPSLQLEAGTVPVVAWEKRLGGGLPRIWFRRGEAHGLEIGPGERPVLLLGEDHYAHVFFLRDGNVYHAREETRHPTPTFAEAIRVSPGPSEDASPPRGTVDSEGRMHLCFSQGGEVFLTTSVTGDFPPPRALGTGDAAWPSVAVSAGGVMGVTFVKSGGIQLALGTPESLEPPVTVVEQVVAPSTPILALAPSSHAAIVFRDGGILYHTTNAEVPQAAFELEPAEGQAPLEVKFTDSSTGPVTSWRWDFGDGSTSADRNPSHTFVRRGTYRVSLSVTGPGGDSPGEAARSVVVQKASNEIHLENVRVFPGQKDVYMPVIATHDQPAQGYTIVATYDPAVVDVRDVEYTHSNIAGLVPELFAVEDAFDAPQPYVTAGILFDISIPFDGRTMPPGSGYRIANLVFDVSPDAPPGTTARIELRNGIGSPPLSNIITVGGQTVRPALGEGGDVIISHLEFPPPRFFRRGDTDGNGEVNITDCIASLNYLFSGAEPPSCQDAADATDDGVVDISDAVFVLAFLFQSGTYLPSPYPNAGMDATEDDLPPCLLRW